MTAVELPKAYCRIPSWEPPPERIRLDDNAQACSGFGSDAETPPWRLALPHVCVATSAGVLFGYHIGVVNIPLDDIARDLGFAGNALAEGLLVSICLFGAVFGCALSGVVADKCGRRRALQLSALPALVGASLSASASGVGHMLSGRMLVGIGLGLGGPVMNMYVSEVSPTSIRGTFGSMCQIANCIGMLGALLVSYPAPLVQSWWRLCFWVGIIPSLVLLIGMHFCVESPRWLFKNGQKGEAEQVLGRLWGTSRVKIALTDVLNRSEDRGEVPWSVLFGDQYRRVLGIGASLFALQQFSGINAMFYFSTTVFKNAGVSSGVAASVAVGVVNLVASCMAASLMDKQGRRSLLLWSFGGMAFAMALLAAAYCLPILQPFQAYLSLGGILMYVFMFAFGAGPVPALVSSELFADRIRGKAMSVCMCVHWIFNFIVGFMFLPMLEHFGAAGLYSFFTLACLYAVVFVKRNIMETSGKSLEELEELLLVAQH